MENTYVSCKHLLKDHNVHALPSSEQNELTPANFQSQHFHIYIYNPLIL